jgi:hypothetical protein
MGLSSNRIQVTLPDGVYQKLEQWATTDGRAIANLASYLVQKSIEDAEEQGKIPEPKLPKPKGSDRNS